MTTDLTRADLVPGVSDLVADVLGLDPRRRSELTADTELFGALPELDSLSVLELATTLESTYGVVVEDEDFTGAVFGSIGTLAEFVAQRSA